MPFLPAPCPRIASAALPATSSEVRSIRCRPVSAPCSALVSSCTARIDAYADTHPAFRRSRARVSVQRRRRIMVDLFYDHFLAVHWRRLAESLPDESELESFTANTYRFIATHPDRCRPRSPRCSAASANTACASPTS